MTTTFKLPFFIAITLVVSLVTAANADVDQTTQTRTRIDTTTLSETERARADAWGLDEDEWRRYDTLLKGMRGSVSPSSLSPIEVLGIHARDESERRRYAEQWARAMQEDAERILAFQRAYDAAYQRLFGNQDLIDVAHLARQSRQEPQSPDLEPGDRLLFFTRLECPSCDEVFVKTLSYIDSVDGVDVYFTGSPDVDGQAIRKWARRQRVDPQWVRTRRLTLNTDNGVLESIKPRAGQAPLLFVRRGGEIRPLPYAEL